MTKYVLKRLFFGICSIFVVAFIVMAVVFTAIDRETIFNDDQQISKLKYNELTMYKYRQWQKYGYLEYNLYSNFVSDKFQQKYGENYTEQDEYKEAVSCLNDENTYQNNATVKEFITDANSKKYEVIFLPKVVSKRGILQSNPVLFAKKERSTFSRLGSFIKNLIKVETIWDVKDDSLTDRYIRFQWDKRSNMPALVGSGTTHKYLIYFDNRFPFIHQNLVHINLSTSLVGMNAGKDVSDIMNESTGNLVRKDQVYPADIDKENPEYHLVSDDYHTVTYSENASDDDIKKYGDKYINASSLMSGFSRLNNSFVIGLIAVILAYLLGIPLGILMAKRKGKISDILGNIYIVFIIAVPSLAYIFIFAAIGTNLFKLPYNWGLASNPTAAFILPIVSLSLPMMGALMKWVRRYMIDQQNADYVKFAKSQGLSKGEIFKKHISKNAFIYIVHSIPADILGCLTGAIITERIYQVPGVGGLLTNAITSYDNGIIVGATVFYSFLSIIAMILGDVLLAKYDPRISFDNKRG